MPRIVQPSFAAGELAPALHGRVDLSKYHVGAATLLNFFVHAHGGASNRPGLEYIWSSPGPGRLIAFTYSVEQAYVLEFTDYLMRVLKDGGLVLHSLVSATYQWTASTGGGTNEYYLSLVAPPGGNPGLIRPPTLFENGAEMPEGTPGSLAAGAFGWGNVEAVPLLFNTIYVRLTDGLSPAAHVAGWVQMHFSVASPYAVADLPLLKFSQSADTLFMVHPSYAPRKLTRSDHDAWTFSTLAFAPELAAPAGLVATFVPVTSGRPPDTRSIDYCVSAVSDSGDESVPSATAACVVDAPWLSGERVSLTWTAVVGASQYRVYKKTRGAFGYIGTATTNAFADDYIEQDEFDGPQSAYDPFTGAGKYPGAVGIFQQRLILARTDDNPQTVWATQTGRLTNMSSSFPLKDTDGIEVTLASGLMDEVRHLVPLNSLIMLTAAGEWLMQASLASEALTPTSVQFRVQGYYRCSDIPPLVVGSTILFVQRSGALVRDLSYSLESDGFVGADLSVMAGHLFEPAPMKEWAYQQEPDSIAWCVMEDGRLLGFTYLREHEVWAWTQHDTQGLFHSVASIPGEEGSHDEVYFQVKRTVGGTDYYYLERLAIRLPDGVLEDAFFVDSGLTYHSPAKTISGATTAKPVVVTCAGHAFSDGDVVEIDDVVGMTELNGNRYKVASAVAGVSFALMHQYTDEDIDGTAFTTYVSGGEARKCVLTISGLDHLEGKAVVALSDGNVVEGLTVASGSVTLPHVAVKVHVGLSYSCLLETLALEPQGSGTVQGARQRVGGLTVRMLNSRGLWCGPDASHLVEMKFRDDEGYDEATRLFTGDKAIAIDARWARSCRVSVAQTYPLPVTILAVIPEVIIGEQ